MISFSAGARSLWVIQPLATDQARINSMPCGKARAWAALVFIEALDIVARFEKSHTPEWLPQGLPAQYQLT
jgi:hypothetical protein